MFLVDVFILLSYSFVVYDVLREILVESMHIGTD